MEPITIEKGKKLINVGDAVECLYVVMSGTVRQDWKGKQLLLGPGTVEGLSVERWSLL